MTIKESLTSIKIFYLVFLNNFYLRLRLWAIYELTTIWNTINQSIIQNISRNPFIATYKTELIQVSASWFSSPPYLFVVCSTNFIKPPRLFPEFRNNVLRDIFLCGQLNVFGFVFKYAGISDVHVFWPVTYRVMWEWLIFFYCIEGICIRIF